MLKRIRNSLIGAIGAPLLRFLWLTLRVSVEDRGGLLLRPSDRAAIYAFWHNRMLLLAPFHASKLSARRCVCLISASADGELIARIVERFEIKAARGSSSRRGKEALRELAVHFENGVDVAITPDGPRGPRYRVQQGIIGLAQRTGALVYPVSWMVDWKIELPSWDRFLIPLPFSRCTITLGEPLQIARTKSEEEFEAERKRLEDALLELETADQNSPHLA